MNEGCQGFGSLRRQSLIVGLLIPLVLALSYWAYAPGINGPYVFDDIHCIVDNPKIKITSLDMTSLRQAFLGGSAGTLDRPLSMLSFGLNYFFSELDVSRFKLTNIAIHLLNGLLVFGVVRRTVALWDARQPAATGNTADAIALVAAALWLLHPVNLTGVLYVVQRMTSLSALFVLAGACFYLEGRKQQFSGGSGGTALFVGVPVCGALGLLAKENAVLLPFLCLTIEISLLRFHCGSQLARNTLNGFFFLSVVVPLYATLVFLIVNPQWVARPDLGRDFDVIERMLTESRVLWIYLRMLFVPALHDLNLYYDNIEVSRSLLSPATTSISIASLIILTAYVLAQRNRFPLLAFGLIWFLCAHLLESTFIMLELMHLHRNYVAYIGPIAALAAGAFRYRNAKTVPLLAIFGVFSLIFAITTHERSTQWAHPVTMAEWEVRHNPNSARAHYQMAAVYRHLYQRHRDERLIEQAAFHFRKARDFMPYDTIGPNVALVIVESEAGKELSASLIANIRRDLVKPNFSNTTLTHFSRLMDCVKIQKCPIPNDKALDLFSAVLANHSLNDALRSRFLGQLGDFYAKFSDPRAAAVAFEDAASLAPDEPVHQMSLFNMYIAIGDLQAAERSLHEADRLDFMGRYTADRHLLASTLSSYKQRRSLNHDPVAQKGG